jgi:nickel-dependent lactate racemase
MMGEKIMMSWGYSPLAIDLPENVVQIVTPNEFPAVEGETAEIKRALDNPYDKQPLRELAAGKKSAVVIISDSSRKFPRNLMLRLVIEELTAAGVELIQPIIGGGNHPEFPDELQDFDDEILHRFPFIRNDSRKNSDFICVGSTSSKVREFFYGYARQELGAAIKRLPTTIKGTVAALLRLRLRHAARLAAPDVVTNIIMALGASLRTKVYVKREVVQADLKVTIGQVKPHYFAGYGGGAKSILPAVASIRSIASNHFMKSHPRCKLGIVDENILRQDMEEAARFCEPVFIVNAVMNGEGELVHVVSGDVVAAHRAGVETCSKISNVPVKKTPIVIISTPYPASMNIYQTTKQVATAAMMLKPGGVIICMGECPLGIGPVFTINHVIFNLSLKGYLPPGADVLLISDLKAEEVARTFFKPMPDLPAALKFACNKLGPDAEITIVPNGSLLVPMTKDDDDRQGIATD